GGVRGARGGGGGGGAAGGVDGGGPALPGPRGVEAPARRARVAPPVDGELSSERPAGRRGRRGRGPPSRTARGGRGSPIRRRLLHTRRCDPPPGQGCRPGCRGGRGPSSART